MAIYFYTHSDTKIADDTKTVYITKDQNSFKLYRNGAPFKIRGASGHHYLNSLSEIGANTIRVYDSISEALLDEAHQNNLAVIIDIPLPKYNKEYNFYSDEKKTNELKDSIKTVVNKYKKHPALLFWNLGNELDYPLVFRKNAFINTFNELIDMIHKEDPNHPVGTCLIPSRTQTLSIHLHSPQLDVIGFNAFGNLKMIKPLMKKIAIVTNVLPYYISEYGSNGPWEETMTPWLVPIEQTSTKKAEQYVELYNANILKDEASLGDLAFFWGQKQEHTHTWFSVFDEDGRKSQVFYSLKSLWGAPKNENDWPPQIKYMLIDNQGANDTLIYSANEIKTAKIIMESPLDTTYQFKWEVFNEGWNYNQTENERQPKKLSIRIIEKKANSLTFNIPDKEGPFRIFAYVYDGKGNFATANIPFYVLKK
ncbi:MAG: glycoside hydrolase family 2 TIM barrel-domain containing protein [Gelidibacter sp.]|uniref:glycoside hydrolase family 2 TIM barrel-domain containing protein n=1 Tax=Gelidibacter sp. TaxID=2018083 RepID=UPI0032647A91